MGSGAKRSGWRVAAMVAAAFAVVVALLYGGFRFYSSATVPGQVNIDGHYLQLACEFCPHVEITTIGPESHGLAAGDMVYPYSDAFDVHAFMAAELLAGNGRRFCLAGRLHRYTGWWPLRPPARPLAVETIAVGSCAAAPSGRQ